jgi:hypothetical protein
MHRTLCTALSCAVKFGNVARNVAMVVDPPRAIKAKSQYMSIEDAQAFLAAARVTACSPSSQQFYRSAYVLAKASGSHGLMSISKPVASTSIKPFSGSTKSSILRIKPAFSWSNPRVDTTPVS